MMKWIKKRENQIFFSVTIVAIIVAIAPLISRYALLGHDSDYHILRIEALKQQIQMGLPFLKVNPTFFGGAGYASSLFYPDFLLYIPALLRVVGFSINSSYHLFMILCVIMCFTVSYICVKEITNNRYIGILFAVIITLASYHLDDIMVRAAVGEYTAIIFIPVVLYGIYNLCFEDMDKPWVLGLGMAAVLLCHTLSFALCLLMIVLMMCLNFDAFLKNPKIILKLIITGLVTMLATISYWLPLLEQFMSTEFYVSNTWIDPAQEAVKVSSLFGLSFPTLGIGLFILLLPRVLIFKNQNDKIMKYADQSITVGLVFAVCASDLFHWDVVGKYFSIVQFPWRLYVISTVLLCFGAAVVIYRLAGSLVIGASDTPEDYDNEIKIIENDTYINKYGVVLGLVLGVMAVTAVYNYSNQTREYYDYSNDYYSYKPFTCSVIGGEWLPVTVTDMDSLIDDSEHLVDCNGNDVAFTRVKNRIVFNTDGSCDYVDVPFVYYKGYEAKDSNGASVLVDGSGHNGLVRAYTKDVSGEITVRYKGTAMQKMALLINILTIAVLAAVCWVKNKKAKNK